MTTATQIATRRAEPIKKKRGRKPWTQERHDAQRRQVVTALRQNEGNISQTSRATGWPRRTLHMWITRYQIDVQEIRQRHKVQDLRAAADRLDEAIARAEVEINGIS
jgi:DNA-binding NtrC family response regulator